MSKFLTFLKQTFSLSWFNSPKSSIKPLSLSKEQKAFVAQVQADHATSLIRILVGELRTLVPSQISLSRQRDPFRDLFEGLTVFDAYGNLVGGMAERWEKDASGMSWRFFIRKNAKWSDGQLVSAEDFVWGWRVAFEEQSKLLSATKDRSPAVLLSTILVNIFPLKNGIAVLKGEKPVSELGVRALEKRILEVQLEAPTNRLLFLSELSHQRWLPMRPEYLLGVQNRQRDLRPEEGKNCVSNGAFCLKSWRLGKELELVKNVYYYGANKVFWPRVKYLLLNDPQIRVHLWDAGCIDLYPLGETEKSELEFDPHYLKKMKHVPANSTIIFICNLRLKKLQSLSVRHAFNMLFPRHELRHFVPSGQWIIYGCLSLDDLPLRPAKPYWITFSMEERIAEARRLLQLENYSASHPLELEVNHFYEQKTFGAVFLQPFLNVPEIKLTIRYLSARQCWDKLHDRTFEICMYAAGSTSKHCLHRFLFHHTNAGLHGIEPHSGYKNPRFSELVCSLYNDDEMSAAEQKEIYEEMEKILVEELPSFPWLLDSVSVLISDRILSASFFKWNYASGSIYSKNLTLSET